MQRKLEPHEKETAIHWDEESDLVEVYTTSPAVQKRLSEQGLEPVYTIEDSWHYHLNKKDIRLKIGREQCFIAGRKTGVRND